MLRGTLVLVLLACLSAGAEQPRTGALRDIAQRAASDSTLTDADGKPFRLRATIIETTNPESGYRGEIEEEWVSPNKWHRTVKSPDFSQTIIVNGDQFYERDNGNYYPSWLRNIVTTIFEPLPMLDALKKSTTVIAEPSGPNSRSCARFQSRTGTPPAQNSTFTVICFAGRPIVVSSIVTPGMGVEFGDYKPFGQKQVARRLSSDPEPGTHIEAKVVELSPLSKSEDSAFVVPEDTTQANRIRAFQVQEATAWSMLLDKAEIQWPPVRSGKTSGVLSVYACADRTGQVREVWPLNSDNAGLDDSVRAQVLKWHFKPAVANGAPVQMESVLTFAFGVSIANPIPVLTNEEARLLATKIVEAKTPPGTPLDLKEFAVRISVNANGEITGTSNPHDLSNPLFFAAMNAVRQWKFKPYMHDGKPDNFDAEITFQAH